MREKKFPMPPGKIVAVSPRINKLDGIAGNGEKLVRSMIEKIKKEILAVHAMKYQGIAGINHGADERKFFQKKIEVRVMFNPISNAKYSMILHARRPG